MPATSRTSATASTRSTRASCGRSSTRATSWWTTAGRRSWTWARPSRCRACWPRSTAWALPREAVDYVIVTHVHLDHAGGAGEMMRLLPQATLVVHPRGARHMIDPAKLWAGAARSTARRRCAATTAGSCPWTRRASSRPRRASRSSSGGRPLVFLDTPGHARHHFCVWDEASRSMFTGDTFGLAYRELASARGAFVMPTTTPVQFEPEALVASIDRLVGYAPPAMLLTHYSRVTEIERLAGDLRRQIGELAALGRAADGKPDRAARLRAGRARARPRLDPRPRHAAAGRARAGARCPWTSSSTPRASRPGSTATSEDDRRFPNSNRKRGTHGLHAQLPPQLPFHGHRRRRVGRGARPLLGDPQRSARQGLPAEARPRVLLRRASSRSTRRSRSARTSTSPTST